MTLFPAIKILAILGVIVGIYFFLEDQLDLSLDIKGSGKDKEEGRRSKYLQSVTGASLEDQLIEVLLMISSSLKAGRNLDQAFELVAVSTPPPICNEFRSLVQERRLGIPMVEALANLASRVPSPDLKLAVNATIFQQETGGNLEDLYRQIVLTVAERKKIMGKVVAGTAHARLSGNLVGSIPLILAVVISTFHPHYLIPMLQNPYGQVVLILSLSAAIVGLLFINRMTASILPDAEEAMINTNEARSKGRSRWKLFRPILAPLAALNAQVPGDWFNKTRLETKFLLEASNKANEFTADEFIGIMELSALLFLVLLGLFINPFVLGMLGWVVLILLIPIGFRLPRIYLASLIRKRQKNIEFELPYVIDLLSLAIESGLDLTGGIAKVVEKQRNTDIIVEFKMFLQDLKVGKSMEEALADMAERVRVLSFFSFVSSLIQAQRLGAEIGPTLRAQAEQMRYQRMILAEERVNKLPVKLLVPLVFFIFPSISVLLIGPAVLQVQQNFPTTHREEAVADNSSAAKAPGTEGQAPGQKVDLNKSIILKDRLKSAAPDVSAPVRSAPAKTEVSGEKLVPAKGEDKSVPAPVNTVPIRSVPDVPVNDENEL